MEEVSAKLVQGASEHEELLQLRDKTLQLEGEIESALQEAETKHQEHVVKLRNLEIRIKSLQLENREVESKHGMQNRQIQRYKNSINEIEIIIGKYDILNQQEQEQHLRVMLSQLKTEVEAVQQEPEDEPTQEIEPPVEAQEEVGE